MKVRQPLLELPEQRRTSVLYHDLDCDTDIGLGVAGARPDTFYRGRSRADFFFFSQLNISYPANGSQKLIDIEDERKLAIFMEKRVRTHTRRLGRSITT